MLYVLTQMQAGVGKSTRAILSMKQLYKVRDSEREREREGMIMHKRSIHHPSHVPQYQREPINISKSLAENVNSII